MNKGTGICFLFILMTGVLLPATAAGQELDSVVTPSMQREMLSYIAADDARGRAAGTRFNRWIADYIHDEFISCGLKPYLDGNYYSQFRLDDRHLGRNVIGMLPARRKSESYIIISAHYDYVGSLNGYTYNGADDNGSGVAALISLAKIFTAMHNVGFKPRCNLIFVALDAKEADMKGSADFVSRLMVPKGSVLCDINLDQMGSSLEPVHRNGKPFVIVLGSETLPTEKQDILDRVNALYDLGFDIDKTFYGSPKFAQYAYKTSDQAVFHRAGIPALLVTSGFTEHTYKTSDDIDIIDFDMLYRRTMLLYHYICNL